MGSILIRGVDARTLERLRARARRHGRSLQGEAKLVLESAADVSVAEVLDRARNWRKKLGRRFEDSAKLIREDRER